LRLRQHPIVFLVALAALIATITFDLGRWRLRAGPSDAQLIAMLPSHNATVFFANLGAVRDAGLMKLLAGVKPAEEKDYSEFVRETQFDYARDIDRLVGSAGNDQLFFLARGRFNWDRLRNYAATHGGKCEAGVCSVPASTPGRWASFEEIESGVIGLAVSPKQDAIRMLGHANSSVPPLRLTEPVWVNIAPSLFKNPEAFPIALRVFVISLESADSVLFTMCPARKNSDAAFEMRLDAMFANQSTAEATAKQMELETRMLKLALMRARDQSSAADLTGLLTAGVFEAKQTHVYGTWSVSKELVRKLE